LTVAILNDWIAKLRALGPTLAKEVAPEVAAALRDGIAANIDAQRGPDGVPWPRPADRTVSIVLRNAMKSVRVAPVGGTVVATLTGPEARHHLGAVRGGTARPILPTRRMPEAMIKAIQLVVTRKIQELLTGSK
jgi:hypothetical protein